MKLAHETPWAWQCLRCNKWNAVDHNRCWDCHAPKGAKADAPVRVPVAAAAKAPPPPAARAPARQEATPAPAAPARRAPRGGGGAAKAPAEGAKKS